jgi:hypothetical protein
MIIHLISSMREFDKDIIPLRKIAEVIARENSSVAFNWYDGVDARKHRNSNREESLDWGEIVESNIRATTESDALIIEGSRFNYSQGFQTAIALQNNKPVLNLYREDLPEYKEWPDKLFVSGISHPLFTSVAYKTEKDLEKIVTKFIREHSTKARDLDVKLALEASDYEKLDRLAHSVGKSKASVIKDILTKNLNSK